MQLLSSLKTPKKPHPHSQILRTKGKVYLICKSNPRFN
ncbi:ribosomal protein bL36, partial [Neisseria sicca]